MRHGAYHAKSESSTRTYQVMVPRSRQPATPVLDTVVLESAQRAEMHACRVPSTLNVLCGISIQPTTLPSMLTTLNRLKFACSEKSIEPVGRMITLPLPSSRSSTLTVPPISRDQGSFWKASV